MNNIYTVLNVNFYKQIQLCRHEKGENVNSVTARAVLSIWYDMTSCEVDFNWLSTSIASTGLGIHNYTFQLTDQILKQIKTFLHAFEASHCAF